VANVHPERLVVLHPDLALVVVSLVVFVPTDRPPALQTDPLLVVLQGNLLLVLQTDPLPVVLQGIPPLVLQTDLLLVVLQGILPLALQIDLLLDP
jgi:hypothetical protein